VGAGAARGADGGHRQSSVSRAISKAPPLAAVGRCLPPCIASDGGGDGRERLTWNLASLGVWGGTGRARGRGTLGRTTLPAEPQVQGLLVHFSARPEPCFCHRRTSASHRQCVTLSRNVDACKPLARLPSLAPITTVQSSRASGSIMDHHLLLTRHRHRIRTWCLLLITFFILELASGKT